MAEVNPKAYPLADAQLTITILDIVQQAAVRAIQSPFLGFFGAANRVSRFSRLRLHTNAPHASALLSDGRLPRDLRDVAPALTHHLTSFFSMRDRYTTSRTTSN
jgi:hypothetical protein